PLPAELREHRKLDIRELASRPDVTPEEIRAIVDRSLRIEEIDLVRIHHPAIHHSLNCTVVMEPFGNSGKSNILCEVDEEARGLLAKRNLSILIADIRSLLSAHSILFFPKIDKYIDEPTEQNWRAMKAAVEEIGSMVALTRASLENYRYRLPMKSI